MQKNIPALRYISLTERDNYRQLACECKCFRVIMFVLWYVFFWIFTSVYRTHHSDSQKISKMSLSFPTFPLPYPQNLFIHFNKGMLEGSLVSEEHFVTILPNFQESLSCLFSAVKTRVQKTTVQQPSKMNQKGSVVNTFKTKGSSFHSII